MWVRLPLATRHKAVRYNPRFPGNGVKNLPTGQGAATRCCLHKGSNYSQVYADRHSLPAVSMPSTFHICLYFLLRKQTRRGSFDQRAALPGDLSIPNRSGANRSLLRFMRLHLSHWVLMMRTLNIPARSHCTEPDTSVNNAANRSRHGRGSGMKVAGA